MVKSEGTLGWFLGLQHHRRHLADPTNLPPLTSKTALITGANSGIGAVATEALASAGAKVFMACRSPTKAASARTDILTRVPDADLEIVEYDASSLAKVHEAGKKFVERGVALDMLLLNAGCITATPVPTAADGLESMFATNHLAHYFLTLTLLPALRRAAEKASDADVRVVVTTSAGFALHPDRGDLHLGDGELRVGGGVGGGDEEGATWWKGAMPMYGRSKTCNILFASELSRRLRRLTEWGQKVRVNAVHPGTVATGLNTGLREGWYFYLLEKAVYALAAVSLCPFFFPGSGWQLRAS